MTTIEQLLTGQKARKPQAIFDAAILETNKKARRALVDELAASIASLSEIVIDGWIEDVNTAGLYDAVKFEKAVKGHKRKQRQHAGKVTHTKLRDSYLEVRPNTKHGLGQWRRYAEGYWHIVSEPVIAHEITLVCEACELWGVMPTASLTRSVLYLTKNAVGVDADLWDKNKDLLVCSNGTVELSTNTIREHQKEDYSTFGVDYDYNPNADCPHFKQAISRLGSAAPFLQEFMGYCLTADTSLETAVWFQGTAGCGKSTIIEALHTILGQRVGMLGLSEIERSRFALTGIIGRTCLLATEQPVSFIRSSHILNAVISGEPLNIEFKGQDIFEYRPIAKILWAMNTLPQVKNAENGLFRRIKILPFPKLESQDRDTTLKAKIEKEAAGILNWAIAGLQRLRERGFFDVPAVVTDATKDFEDSNNKIVGFIDEQCEIGNNSTTGQALYSAFKDWAFQCGYRPISRGHFYAGLALLGYEKKKTNKGQAFAGLSLTSVGAFHMQTEPPPGF